MKRNQNNTRNGEYYIGLDIGTNSVGFAATDNSYNLLKHSGKTIWGTRLFEEGETAQKRRINRTNRRRLARRTQRLELLRMIFDEEISKVDAGFFMRLKESFLSLDDKTSGVKYSLFADADFTDKEYMKKYPTIYHLRNELAKSPEKHDVRLVYLAIRHIIKNRGHFLFDIENNEDDSFDSLFERMIETLAEFKEIELNIKASQIYEIITCKASKSDRVKAVLALCSLEKKDKKVVEKLFSLIVGGKVKLSDIFDTEYQSFSFDSGDEKLMEASEEIGEGFELIFCAKKIYDFLILEKITKGYNSISEYKIAEYEQHKIDIKTLKFFIKAVLKNDDLYKELFKLQRSDLPNYPSYSKYKKGDLQKTKTTQQDFCKFLKSKLPKEYENDPEYAQMYQRINEGVFAPRLRETENGVIPNGLHRDELVKILENASEYLPFLNAIDENDNITIKDKILSIFDFKIPYYIGPLKNGWAVKKSDGTIYPWNFEKKIDLEASAELFITRMTSLCIYTAEDVLPKNSLLYSEFEVLNEINNIRINEEPISVECKKKIFEDLFLNSSKKVTKSGIEKYLRLEGLLFEGDNLSGVDSTLKSQLTSYHKLKNILSKTSYDQVEEIIKRITLFGEDKKLLKKYLKEKTNLCEADISYLLKQKFEGWGRLSKELLDGIMAPNPATGELVTIIQMMRETNLNLMKLLATPFEFKKMADEHRAEKIGFNGTPREMVDALYVSPKIRRSIWQTLRILDEIVDIEKGAPRKIFIEVARENESEDTKKKNEAKRKSRKEQLIAWYKECKQNSGDLFEKLENEDEGRLRSKKLYLYYMQFGKCMYSGEPINIDELNDNFKYDIDHIFPRSKIKDDSFDNLVLVKAELNREKTNKYPISDQIREKMQGFWAILVDRGTISSKKYERLIRHTPLTEDELAKFINRQIVETRQSTKAIAELLKILYPNTKIVYSKAANVTEFRNFFGFVKCREINDHHHAKDAYLNIVVGNYFDTRFNSDFIRNILTEDYSLNPEALYCRNVKGAWQKGPDGTISIVAPTMAKNNILFTIMPEEKHGQLYDVTIMKKGKGQVPIKETLDINQYGGYNKASGAYFVIVEHEENGKIIRSIEAVLKHQKVEYESDPSGFAKAHWYPNAKIILNKILFNSIFEIDGIRLSITKRQNEHIGFIHTCQLIIGDKEYSYIKNLCDYLDKYDEKNPNPSKSKMLFVDKNIEIYDMFVDKIQSTIYSKILSGIAKYMIDYRDKFVSMSLLDQCKTLKEILKSFRCNAMLTSLELLCKKGNVGSILKNKKISELNSVYLIHQSVTGIFETKINLLK